MKGKFSANATIGLVATMSLLLFAVFIANTASPAPAAMAREEGLSVAGSHSVTVVGEGTVSIEPDIATASIGVEVVRPSVREASVAAQTIMEEVQAALLSQSIDGVDIQTRHFSIFAERFGPGGLLNEDEVRYRVSNTVFITIRELESIGDVLDAAIEAGANNIYGVDFSLANPATVESEAREQAVVDAHSKAEELAELIGVGVGEVMGISEIIGQGGGFFGGNFSRMAMSEMGGGAGPISPGELNLTMQLQITYELR
jgi:uncharacterized protein YggE